MHQILSTDILLCEGFRLDRLGLSRLDPGGVASPVALGSRALDLAWLLVDRHGELISKDEIMETVWPGRVVEENNLTVQISTLRRVLDQARAEGSCIQTVVGHGYRFVAPITRIASEALSAVALSASNQLPALPDKPSIAVLPFANMSGDPEQEYFVDGMVEEIITALSRIRWLFVIARNSSLTYKGQAIDVEQVGRELGVRYVLEGSVRKAGQRVRITAQLIDALAGTHLWADHFDGSLEDLFDLQDKVAVSVAGVIEPALLAAEIRRSAARPTTDLSAYDLYLRALAAFYPIITKERILEVLGLLDQAIAIDRHYGPALSWAAVGNLLLVDNGWAEEPERSRLKGVALARQALQVAQNDPGILANAAFVLGFFDEDIGAMIALVDRAIALNPSYARGWYLSSFLRLFAGRIDRAIEHVETSLRLSPRRRMGHPLFALGLAHFFKRQFDEAAANLLLSIQDQPDFPYAYRALAACYAHMGRLDEARAIVTRLRAITLLVVPSHLPWRDPEHRELLLSGLRLAAGAES
jgi:TolB-like protein